MGIYKDIIILIIGIAAIIKSADLFTQAAESIAVYFKIPRAVIGLTIVSMATTMPEFAVSVFSSAMGAGGLAVGNAIGSCLANIGLILGLAAVISAVKFNPQVIKQELSFLLLASLLIFLLMSDGQLQFQEGVFLCALLVLFFVVVVRRELSQRKQRGKSEQVGGSAAAVSIKKEAIKFSIGAVGVVIAAKYAIIPSGIVVAKFFRVPEVVIGISMIAVGTSLPELVTAITASFKKMGELAAGNVIGANILNLLWVLGFSSMVNPLAVDINMRQVTLPLMIAMTFLLIIFSRTKFELSRAEGSVFLLLYTGYIFYIIKFAYA